MSARAGRLRATNAAWRVALLPPAAFAVHQLRYELAFGAGARLELQRTGHSYLHSAVPWLVGALAVAAGAILTIFGQALRGHTTPRRFTSSLASLWAGVTVALVAIFAGQELLEGLFFAGHPAGWAGVFGNGGWWAVPVAACVGLVLAALLHGARWIVAAIERAVPRTASRRGPARLMPWPPELLRVAAAPLMGACGSRGPPRLR